MTDVILAVAAWLVGFCAALVVVLYARVRRHRMYVHAREQEARQIADVLLFTLGPVDSHREAWPGRERVH